MEPYLFLFYSCDSGDQIQSLIHDRQVLCCWATPQPTVSKIHWKMNIGHSVERWSEVQATNATVKGTG